MCPWSCHSHYMTDSRKTVIEEKWMAEREREKSVLTFVPKPALVS